MTCGIYEILNVENGKRYIGSSIDAENRIKQHIAALINGKHINRALQKDWPFIVEFKILETCEEIDLLTQEQKWIKKYHQLYNKTQFVHIKLNDCDKIRFFQYLDSKDNAKCWNWLGANRAKNKSGYGKFVVNGHHISAHICSYYFANNQWPKGIVRHTCHNKLCCNPSHLLDGSFSQNKQDDILESRLGKLNWQQINELREYFKLNPEICQHELAKWFANKFNIKCAPNYLINICKNKTWKDKNYQVPIRENQKNKKLIGNKNGAKITWDIVNDIRFNLFKISLDKISEKINNKYNLQLSKQQISRILRNERWYDKNYNRLAIC